MATLNIIGKVDNTHPLITTSVVNVPLNEALTITDEDYIKFKKELEEKNKNKALVDRFKNDKFQQTFKELWPHTYDRINDSETSAAAMLEKLNRQKALYNSILAHDLNCCKACLTDTRKLVCKDCNEINYLKTMTCSPACIDGCKLANNHCCCRNTYIPTTIPTFTHTHTHTYAHPVPTPPPQPSYFEKKTFQSTDLNYSKLPNLVSGYDLPYLTWKDKEDLVKSSYNKDDISQDVKLLQSLKTDNEKLRLHNKIEKTNDLVDNIIEKVTVLQTDLKKKAAEIQIKEDMMKLKDEYDRMKRTPSLKSILKNRTRSKSPVYRRERTCSAKRSKSPGHHHHHYYDYKHTTASSSSDDYELEEAKQKRFWKSWKDVPSRVDSWNCDWNIY